MLCSILCPHRETLARTQCRSTIFNNYVSTQGEARSTMFNSVSTQGESRSTMFNYVSTQGEARSTMFSSVSTQGEARSTMFSSVSTQGEARSTMFNSVSTQGEARSTMFSSVSTQGEARSTMFNSVSTQGEARSTMFNSVSTQGEARSTMFSSVSTQGEARSTMFSSVSTQGEARSTMFSSVSTQGEAGPQRGAAPEAGGRQVPALLHHHRQNPPDHPGLLAPAPPPGPRLRGDLQGVHRHHRSADSPGVGGGSASETSPGRERSAQVQHSRFQLPRRQQRFPVHRGLQPPFPYQRHQRGSGENHQAFGDTQVHCSEFLCRSLCLCLCLRLRRQCCCCCFCCCCCCGPRPARRSVRWPGPSGSSPGAGHHPSVAQGPAAEELQDVEGWRRQQVVQGGRRRRGGRGKDWRGESGPGGRGGG